MEVSYLITKKNIRGKIEANKYEGLLKDYHNLRMDILKQSKTLIDPAMVKTAGKVIQVAPKENDFQYHRAVALTSGNVIEHEDGSYELIPFETYQKNLAKYSKYCRNSNDNGDAFMHEHLTNDKTCEAATGKKLNYEQLNGPFETLRGKSIFVDHNNENVEDARGIILDVVYNPDKYLVEILFAIDKVAFPELAKALRTQMITDVSMGCTVEKSICSICGNECTTEENMCEHIRNYKGMTMSFNGEMLPVMEYNINPEFFETSIVTTGADREAKIMERVAGLTAHSVHTNMYLHTQDNKIINEQNQRFSSGRIQSLSDKLKNLPWS